MADQINVHQEPSVTRLSRIVAGGISAVCLGISTPAVVHAAPNADVVQARNNVNGLIAALSKSNSDIAALELKMGRLREAVNKALVDFHAAQADATKARTEADQARAALDTTQGQITKAQKVLDDISNIVYRGSSSSAISGVVSKPKAEDTLDRHTLLRTNADKQRDAMTELDKLRTQQTNEESSLRAARDVAEKREQETDKAKQEAQKAIDDAAAELKQHQAEHAALVASRDAAQKELDTIQAKQKTTTAKATTSAAPTPTTPAKQKSEAKPTEATAIADSIAKIVGSSQPDHTSLNLKPVAENITLTENDVDDEDDDEEENEDTQDQAQTQAPAQSQGGSTNPTQEANKVKDGELTLDMHALSSNGPGSVADLLKKLSEAGGAGSDQANINLNGDRASKIETVIARAESQLGVPYAWGGGDANGPTLGIRDGGVADSFGDFEKIGFDCSGLTLYAFAGVGIALPHYTGYQYQFGTKVSPQEMQRGDLIFYGANAEDHVAIYLGDGQMIEAPQSGSEVVVSPVRWGGMSPQVVRLL